MERLNLGQIVEECQCPQSGFCDFFGQEMTYDPPNWQWCQNATPKERMWYKKQCEKKKNRIEKEQEIYLDAEYITSSQLIKDCRDLLLPQVAELDIKGVLGIPRSGMLPASMVAMWLSLPMYTLGPLGDLYPLSGGFEFGGGRMSNHKGTNGRLLVIDDTIYSGAAMEGMKGKLLEDIYSSCIYFRPESQFKPDFYARELKAPHLLEWNLFNCVYIKHALFDFDGIFCPNVPLEVCNDEDKYVDYITNVSPFYHRIPKTRCMGIVTARLEKYRDITERWLKKHDINYGFLEMYPTDKEEIRNKNHVEEASTFKADMYVNSDARFFVESEMAEAVKIREKSGKLVICPK
jgi:adenine/guanine phosphoribosyltransferase-like PRPP-binding protein